MHEIFGAIQLEVVQFQRDRDLGDRVVEHERVFKLSLLVGLVELREFLVGIVALAVRDLGVQRRAGGERDLHAMKLAVEVRVIAVKTEDVIARHRLRRLDNAHRQVVVVEHRLAACVFRERIQRVLRALKSHLLRAGALAVEHREAAGRSTRGIAERRVRHKAARVDRKDRDVRTQRRVRRRSKLRLVVDAVQPQPAREVHERFLIRQRTQHAHGRLQCRQLTIGIQNRELRIVLAEGRAFFELIGNAIAVLVFAEHQGLHHFEQLRLVVGEVLLHADAAALESHHGDQIGRCHLRLDVFHRGVVRAQQIRGRHRRQIEIEHEQTTVAIFHVARLTGCNPDIGGWLRGFGRGRRSRCGRGVWRRVADDHLSARARGRQLLELDEADRLRLAVFGDDEVFGGEAFDRLAVLVFHVDRLDDQPRRAAEGRCRLRWRRRLHRLLREDSRTDERGEDDGERGAH